jgi:hypothetical protein
MKSCETTDKDLAIRKKNLIYKYLSLIWVIPINGLLKKRLKKSLSGG